MLQRLHGGTDLGSVAALGGSFKRLRRLNDRLIQRGERGGSLLALLRLALESLVNGLAESVPQLLLLTAIQRHHLRLLLPTLLQRFHGIDTQMRFGGQGLGLFDQGVSLRQAGLLHGSQGGLSLMEGGLPQGLYFVEHFLADMTGITPAVRELVQGTVDGLPVGARRVRNGPGLELFNQGQTLRAVLGTFGTHFVEPAFHHLVRAVARLVKALPQAMVG